MSSTLQCSPGAPYPLGAHRDGDAVNFAVYAPDAVRVELCLFDAPEDKIESHRVHLTGKTGSVRHVRVRGVSSGQIYGYRVHGDYDPYSGLRHNAAKVLFDPYARAVGRPLRWADELFGYPAREGAPAGPKAIHNLSQTDSAAYAPLSAFIEGDFDWEDDAPPRVPRRDAIIYEAHVKGFTKRLPDVPPELRGTYAGFASEPAVEHLRSLGVTAVELLPVHHHVDEHRLSRLGLKNYWGYNTLGFFAPEPAYADDPSPEGCAREFKSMVKALHKAGIEVILDVVYNHTCEAGELGPTLCWRGFSEIGYYRLDPQDPCKHVNYSGTGNTTDMRNPWFVRMVADSLRYWVEEMRVDGFRFDLATILGRESDRFEAGAGFFDAVFQDPILSRVKLIAEPWDVGPEGYQVGAFPENWAEWNGRFRDDLRRFWRGDAGMLGAFATRFAGSSDLYGPPRRRAPWASVNFITSHDGFTLHDLVSHERKHNLANGEHNRDGDNHNLSENNGVEGPTDDPEINRIRLRQKKNFLASLFLAAGTPLLPAGDEMGRTQLGNNNAYCQDNEISWLDWTPADDRAELLAFVKELIALRKRAAAPRRDDFFTGAPSADADFADIAWFGPEGRPMRDAHWREPDRRALGVLIGPDVEGGEALYLIVNAARFAISFQLPPAPVGKRWEVLFDTARNADDEADLIAEHIHRALERSFTALVLRAEEDEL